MLCCFVSFFFFFFNDTATTEIYTLSLHDALPIYRRAVLRGRGRGCNRWHRRAAARDRVRDCERRQSRARRVHGDRSEEHTSELQSQSNLVCRLLLEKKKKKKHQRTCTNTYHTSIV